MKKRIISMLLTVLMVMSLFSGLPLSAYAATTAGANTIEYTMAAGDYVLRICQKFGLNYYTCKDAIMILNNIYDGQWNKLAVGRTLTLPASDNDAILIANGAKLTNVNSGANATTLSTGTAATYATGTATTGTSVATTTTFKSADSLAYYLVPYTMSAGENVSGVCNSLGVNFNIFSPFIKQVNGISDWTKVRAGQTLIIPTPVCPSVGTTCYGVMQHKVGGSDTAYGIASSNGVNYNANKTLLEVLNQTNNLANLTAGQWFYYPVPLTVSVPGTGNPGSTTTTTTTSTTTDGNGTTTTTSTTTSKLYKLTSGMSASDGTMLFYVNNQAVTAAPAGAKVTIVTDTTSGKAIQSLTVKHSDGKADLKLTGDTFVMPSCDVRVDSEIRAGHDININANYSGKGVASVNNVTVQAAVKGAAVVIKSNDPNYEVSAVYAYYKKLISSSTKTALTVSSSNAFIMPDADVDVEVVLKPVSTYAFYVKEADKEEARHGTFYLEVNGNPVTRAAKGTKVTVVTKADEGYEPSSISVTKVNGETINVFSNTFTMPSSDVIVEVGFAAKGNNILMMPSQTASIFAFKEDAVPAVIASVTDLDSSITEADTNAKVYLIAVDVDDPDAKDIDAGDYTIEYDIVRNSDGLKVKATEDLSKGPKNGWWFRMPKGGVTVTPIITARNKVQITGEIYRTSSDGTVQKADGKYLDCSFSVTYNDQGKEKRAEFNGKKNDTPRIAAFEYVDLRYEVADGVAFTRYEIVVDNDPDSEQSELLTNEANLHGYFQIPEAKKGVTIKAFFETGKVAIGPAVYTGIGTASYKIAYLDDEGNWQWRSANSCAPGDKVLVVVKPGNGFKFDDKKFEDKLIVTRKDNGARLTLKSAGSTLEPDTYAYFFENMPADGVDVQVIFDPAPFTITMHCYDEAGNNLTGQGLWQIAINWVPGVVDNWTTVINGEKVTQFDVAYEDYVTVAMTEAGWSKYDMVSFRINGLEYTADQLNYFYNFQMIDDRAKDLTITAVLRPKNVGIHTLSAIYDTTKLGVEFLIIASPTGYSDEYRFNKSGALNYLNKAVTGDKIAIVANSIDNKYRVEAKDISITAFGTDADRIVPTEEWINEYGGPGTIRVFTFTMPDADVYVQINVSGTQHGLSIDVYDAKDNAPVNGMVRLFATTATGATISRDVGANNNFDDIPYKSVVQILRSELALAEGKVIKDVEISTASGKSINYTDMTTAGEGIYFTMPDEAVRVIIRIDDQHYNIPTVVVDTQVKNGKLVYRKGQNLTDPVCSLSDFKAGEVVYVFDEPNDGYKHLGLGDLKIYVNGMNNAVNVTPVSIATIPHVWSFTMPEGTIILKAEFQKEEAKTVPITLAFIDENGDPTTDAKYKVKVSVADLTNTFTAHDTVLTFNVLEGKTLTIVSDSDGYSIARIQAASGRGVNGTTYTVPSLDDIAPATADTVTIYMKSESNSIKWQATGGSLQFEDQANLGTYVLAAHEGATVQITATPDTASGYKALKAINLIVAKSDASEVVPVNFVTQTGDITTWTFTMPAGGVLVKATFEKDSQVQVTFNVTPATAIAKLSMGTVSGNISGLMTYEIPVDTKIKIESATEGYDKVTIVPDMGILNGNTYTVTDGPATVNIILDSSKNLIKKNFTNGDLNFYSQITPTKELLKNDQADTGATIYIDSTSKSGYAALQPANLKIVSTKTKEIVDVDTVTYSPFWSFTMPAGGVDVTAVFEARPLTITLNITGGDAVISGRGTSTGALNLTAYAGETITFTPAEGYEWAAGGMTAAVGTPNVTAATTATGSSSYKVTAAIVEGGSESLTVNLQPKS